MTTAQHQIPDYTTDDAATYKAKIDGNAAVAARIAGAYQAYANSTPNMTVKVAAGALLVAGAVVENAIQTTGTITAPVSNSRIDRVVIDATTGVVSVITGTPGVSPSAPALTAGKLPVAQVLLTSASTAITNSMITDERAIMPAQLVPGIVASGRNIAAKNNTGTPNSQIDIAADEVSLEDASNAYYTARSVAVTVNIATSGAGGLDTGAEASGTWYYLWLIYNGSAVAGLISASSTAPTMPSGYTYKALVGVARNDGSSNFLVFQQFNREWRCSDQTVFSATTGSTSYSSQSISAYVPPVAKSVFGNFGSDAVVGVRAIAIASDANGLGAVRGHTGSSGGMDSWRGPMPYRLMLNTAQNLHWKTEVADVNSYRLSINGFEF